MSSGWADHIIRTVKGAADLLILLLYCCLPAAAITLASTPYILFSLFCEFGVVVSAYPYPITGKVRSYLCLIAHLLAVNAVLFFFIFSSSFPPFFPYPGMSAGRYIPLYSHGTPCNRNIPFDNCIARYP